MEDSDQAAESQDQASVEQNPVREVLEVTSAPSASTITKGIKTNVTVMVICVLIILVAGPANTEQFWVVMPMLAFVITVIEFILNLIKYRPVKRLDSKGVLIRVILKDCNIDSNYALGWSIEVDHNSFYILEYDLPEGFRVKNSVSKEVFDMVNKGDPVNVRYLPDSLRLQRVELNAWQSVI